MRGRHLRLYSQGQIMAAAFRNTSLIVSKIYQALVYQAYNYRCLSLKLSGNTFILYPMHFLLNASDYLSNMSR